MVLIGYIDNFMIVCYNILFRLWMIVLLNKNWINYPARSKGRIE